MTTLAPLHQGVRAIIASKRIGTPVFVRYHVQGLLTGAAIVPDLAQLIAEINAWFGQPAQSLYSLASGKVSPYQNTLEVRYPQGESALLSEVHNVPGNRGVSLMLLGTKGAIYHPLDGASTHLWSDAGG